MTTDWQPGDPYMPDNGCGGWPHVPMTEDERAEITEDTDAAPPWWRPGGTHGAELGYTRSCAACGVRWRGDEPCWMCDGSEAS
jgi:hypothetical protein